MRKTLKRSIKCTQFEILSCTYHSPFEKKLNPSGVAKVMVSPITARTNLFKQ